MSNSVPVGFSCNYFILKKIRFIFTHQRIIFVKLQIIAYALFAQVFRVTGFLHIVVEKIRLRENI